MPYRRPSALLATLNVAAAAIYLVLLLRQASARRHQRSAVFEDARSVRLAGTWVSGLAYAMSEPFGPVPIAS
jgi:hypothetical protein